MIDTVACRIAALAILAAGGVHLDLWLWHGYRSLHVIGTLFLLNAIAAAAIGAASRLARRSTPSSRRARLRSEHARGFLPERLPRPLRLRRGA